MLGVCCGQDALSEGADVGEHRGGRQPVPGINPEPDVADVMCQQVIDRGLGGQHRVIGGEPGQRGLTQVGVAARWSAAAGAGFRGWRIARDAAQGPTR